MANYEVNTVKKNGLVVFLGAAFEERNSGLNIVVRLNDVDISSLTMRHSGVVGYNIALPNTELFIILLVQEN